MIIACSSTGTPHSLGSLPQLRLPVRCKLAASQPCRVLYTRRYCSVSCSAVSQLVDQQDHLQTLAQQRSKQLQNCRVDTSRETAILLTSTSAQAGQVLLNVPESSWISLQTVQKSPIGSSIASLEPWLQVALFILFGLSDQNSDWSEYLLSLPGSFNVPLLWEEQELDHLEGTQLLSTVQGYR